MSEKSVPKSAGAEKVHQELLMKLLQKPELPTVPEYGCRQSDIERRSRAEGCSFPGR
ncbi:MAG: hypothetical protein Q4E91_03320 [Lachnospiraceae bacterium]|nr:hypothetical protein [Lachnospiraceae bacterium]